MRRFNFITPKRIKRVRLLTPEEAAAHPAMPDEAWAKGHQAGYRSGMWAAELEARRTKAKAAAETALLTGKIQNLHQLLFSVAEEHLPYMMSEILSRILSHHQFTEEEIFNEIRSVIEQLKQASKIEIECNPTDMEMIKTRLEAIGASLPQSRIEWKENENLQPGEYILRSDLGEIDGRRLERMARVNSALCL